MSDFNTHGGYFSPDNYFRVDTGGSHEENPNGGVQVGVDEQGVPNMLEEGEPVYNDFVYSDNIRADKEMIEKHNLPTKYIGKLYSEIADDFVDEAEERPNDPISNSGLNAMLVRLAEAQEEQKQIAEQKEIEDEIANLSPEELAELEAMLGQAEGEQMQEQVAPEQAMMEQAPVAQGAPMMQEAPGMLPYALGGPVNKFVNGGSNGNWFTRMMLNSVLNDPMSGPVAVASGWDRDENGNVVHQDFGGEGAEKLRESLREISTIPLSEMGLGLLGQGYRTWRGIDTATDILDAARAAKAEASSAAVAEKAASKAKEGVKAVKESRSAAKSTREAAIKKANEAKEALKKVVSKNDLNSKAVSKAIDKYTNATLEAQKAKSAVTRGVFASIPAYLNSAAVATGEALRYIPKYAGAVGVAATEAAPYMPLVLRDGESSYTSQSSSPDSSTTSLMFYDAPAPTPEENLQNNLDVSGLTMDDFADSFKRGGKMNFFFGGGDWDGYVPGSMTPEEYARIHGLTLPAEESSSNMTREEAERIAGRSLPMDVAVPDVEVKPFDFNQTLRMGFVQPATAISTKGALVMPDVKKSTIDRTRYDAMQRAAQYNAEETKRRAAVRPTWPMYAGAIGNGLMALQTALTPADRYTLPRYNPALPYGELSLQREVYNPVDQNMLTQSILASNAAAYRSLRNSGVGPSTAASIVAADNNATQNMGQGFLQTWDANNQRRNAVIAANNQVTGQESQFDYGVNQARTNILNDAAMRNMQNDLLLQRLNNQAESEKYAALSQNLNAGLTDLSNIGRTNFAANQVNSNTALYWDTLPDGTVVYRRPERQAKCGGFIKQIKKK